MVREFAEELRGGPEDYANHHGPLDYDSWPFARQMTDALDRGQVRVWCLGLGVDPLTYSTDLLTVAVIESTEGGETACWAHLVCPECGAMVSEGHATGRSSGPAAAQPS